MEKLNQPALILVDKPFGLSSQQAVNRVKRQLNLKKIGHCGTLDPAATGLLVCLTGAATRLASLIEKQEKVYTGLIRFGESRTSYDLEGEIVETSSKRPSIEEVRNMVQAKFLGNIRQLPPKYSALKIDGQRAYALARKGEDFELKMRDVTITQFDVQQVDSDHVSFTITSSVGTYIRSLANDLGGELGIPSCLASLRREAIGDYQVSLAKEPEALTLENLKDWSSIFPKLERLQPNDQELKMLLNGDVRVFASEALGLSQKIAAKRVIYERDGQALGLLAIRDNKWVFEFQAYGPQILSNLEK